MFFKKTSRTPKFRLEPIYYRNNKFVQTKRLQNFFPGLNGTLRLVFYYSSRRKRLFSGSMKPLPLGGILETFLKKNDFPLTICGRRSFHRLRPTDQGRTTCGERGDGRVRYSGADPGLQTEPTHVSCARRVGPSRASFAWYVFILTRHLGQALGGLGFWV